MTQTSPMRRCQQCENLVSKLFPIRQESGRDISVCAGCYGLGLAQQQAPKLGTKSPSSKTSD